MTTNAVTFTIGPPFAVSSEIPANAAANVPINQVLSATFSAALNCATVTTTTFTVSGGVKGTVTCAGSTATFTPTSHLASNTSYTATLTTGIMNSIGAPLLSNFTWTFTTAPLPTVTSTTPTNGATGVPTSQVLTANFSQAVNCATITTSTFTVSGGVAGTARLRRRERDFYAGKPSRHQLRLHRHDYHRGYQYGRRSTGEQLCLELYNRCDLEHHATHGDRRNPSQYCYGCCAQHGNHRGFR